MTALCIVADEPAEDRRGWRRVQLHTEQRVDAGPYARRP